jgi:hypothetical protein
MENELDAQKRRTTGEHEASNIAIGQLRHEQRVLDLGDTKKFWRGAEEMVQEMLHTLLGETGRPERRGDPDGSGRGGGRRDGDG